MIDTVIARIARLNEIGIALSAEKNMDIVCDKILKGAMELTNADGGSLYTMTDDRQRLAFAIVFTHSLNVYMGGNSGKPINFPPIELYENGKPNLSMVVSSAVHDERTINIPDAYHAAGFDFSGTRNFDQSTGYRTQSILTIPMKNHEAEIIGVLQLINAQAGDDNSVREFGPQDQQLAESLASQAAVAMTNTRLIEEQRELFEAFIKLIASAIDEKSPYTGGHCKRLPELTMMIAQACDREQEGPLKDFHMTEKDRYELRIAGWLHDCGKVTTPEYVIDKATKLETIYDRINTVDARFEVLKRDARIEMLENRLQRLAAEPDADTRDLERAYEDRIKCLDDDRAFVRASNVGGEFMDDALQQRIRDISQYNWIDANGVNARLLDENEVMNLVIQRGTLNDEERRIINNHIVVTINMLDELPFPKHLKHVPEYAGGHHERMDGTGYPKGLRREQMSVQARMMGIADIFEALTASDRPYKTGKKLTECLRILGFMKQDHHIDPDIFDVFIREKVYMTYARKFLPQEQIDEVDESKIPGYAV
jgi:HD-GYP domain-containing protein (c-di-GMP phosphodiesterase class II)